jgi:hypothetical protein
MLTARENFMNFYKNKPMDRFPDLFTDANFLMSITGMGDRPPNNRGGKDWYGCSWVYEADAMDSCVPDLSVPPLFEEIEEWREKMIFPDPDAVDWKACAKADEVEDFDPDKINYLTLMEGPFERLHTIMGFENAMVAMVTNPDEVNALLERLTDIKMQNIRVLADYYKVDVINYHDDWGTQNNLFFAPEMWRELIRPHIKRAVDYTHELGLVFG